MSPVAAGSHNAPAADIDGRARPARPREWRTARGTLRLDRPLVMGVVNITPDSFWADSRVGGEDAIIARAERLLAEGADIIDLGGESTRPGARAVPAAVELARVLPAVRALARRFPAATLSVDSVKAEVARAALDEGVAIINDVSGLRFDPALGEVIACAGAGCVLMHSRGGIENMASYDLAVYGDDPVGEIAAELGEAWRRAREAGVADACVALDPGLGFAKRTEHSVAVLRELRRIAALGRPVVIGASRKRFVGELAGGLPPEARLEASLAAAIVALRNGASIFRVHDIVAARRALDVAAALDAHADDGE